jgi:hypothetical protein
VDRVAPTGAKGTAPAVLDLTGTVPPMWTDTLPQAARLALDDLAAPDRAVLASLHARLEPAGQEQLVNLLGRGTLTERAASGERLLDTLNRLAMVPLALPPGVESDAYRQEQLLALVAHIDDPGTIFQGIANTCGPAVVQIGLAANRPADYALLALGLLTTGTGPIPVGGSLPRLPDSLPKSEIDRRPAVSRLVQAALLAWSSPLSYSAKSDRNGIDLPLIGRIDLAPGASGAMEAQMWQAATGKDLRVLASRDLITVIDGGGPLSGRRSADLLSAVDADLADQAKGRLRQPLVPLELDWGKGSHWIGITSATADRVYFRNPSGNLFRAYADGVNGQPRPRHVDPINGQTYVEATASFGQGPRLRVYVDGTQSIARADLEARVYAVVVSAKAAAAVD